MLVWYTEAVSKSAHTLLILMAILGAYIWLLTPVLRPFSLQAFVLSFLAYFFIKFVQKQRLWHILPGYLSIEIALASFAFLLLIGATGNTNSLFFSLSYVHLFFLTFSTDRKTAIIATMAVVLFHFALEKTIGNIQIIELSTIPIMTVFFLFAKAQYDEVTRDRAMIESQRKIITQLSEEEQTAVTTITDEIVPKIAKLAASSPTADSSEQLQNLQVELLELTKVLEDESPTSLPTS